MSDSKGWSILQVTLTSINSSKYVLITPARNEEAYIERTIKSVVSQTVLPMRWVIVSDGSTDATDDIIKRYAIKYNYIEFVSASSLGQRNFGSKANAITAGYKKLNNLQYNYIGNLDADISFPPTYFDNLFKKFDEYPQLGIGGGIIQELVNGKFVVQRIHLNSVAGAVQLFRRKCFEDIGGYLPIKTGGIDAAAEIIARMKGWEVRTFPEFKILHHRRVATSRGGIIKARFRQGIMFYSLGYHPFFHFMRCLRCIVDNPYILGSITMMIGFFWANIKKKEISLPEDAVSYLRKEQMKRIRRFF